LSWTGCGSVTGMVCTVTMTASKTVTANYTTPAPVTYTLTVNSVNPASGVAIGVAPADNNASSGGSTTFTRTYNSGTSVTLTAPATAGAGNFTAWTGCTSTSASTCMVTLNANTTVTANYAPVTYTLSVRSANPASGVSIGVTPADNNNDTSGATGFTRTYNAGASVTLTASASTNTSAFGSWSGCTSASTTTCQIAALNANTTVTANYISDSGFSDDRNDTAVHRVGQRHWNLRQRSHMGCERPIGIYRKHREHHCNRPVHNAISSATQRNRHCHKCSDEYSLRKPHRRAYPAPDGNRPCAFRRCRSSDPGYQSGDLRHE
jgi:hypothetical protein